MNMNRTRLALLSSFGLRDTRNAIYGALQGAQTTGNVPETEFLFTSFDETLSPNLTYETNGRFRISLRPNNWVLRTDYNVDAIKPRWQCREGFNAFDGILIEQSNTNLIAGTDATFYDYGFPFPWQSSNIDVFIFAGVDYPWQTGNLAADRIVEVPGGSSTSKTLVTRVGAGSVMVTQNVSYTQSIYITRGDSLYFDTEFYARYVQLIFPAPGFPANSYATFDLQLGTVVGVGAGSSLLPTITPVVNQEGISNWYRISLTSICNLSSDEGVPTGRFKLNIVNTAAATQGQAYTRFIDQEASMFVCGAQYEQNNYASSYFYSDATPKTRPSDNLTLADSNFTNIYKSSTGTNTIICEFFIDLTKAFGTGNRTVFSIDNGANKHLSFFCNRNTNYGTLVWSAGFLDTSSNIVNGLNKVAITVNGTTNAVVKVCLNGGAIFTGTSDLTPANQTWLNIGSKSNTSTTGFSDHLNDVFKKLKIYKSILPDATLQSLTA